MRTEPKHLKDESYYSNLYDEATVERCREIVRREGFPKQVKGKGKMRRLTPKDLSAVTQIYLWAVKGERYSHKAETVREWMARDRRRDDTYENAVIPDATCPDCGNDMDCTYKHLHSEGLDESERVLFWFRCPGCSKVRAIFEGGEEWQAKPHLCPKCQTPMKGADERKGKVITSTDTCPNCGHTETSTLDLTVKKAKKPEPKPDPDFEKDRKEFCLSDEEGQDYIQWMANVKELNESMKKEEAKQANKKVYAAVKKLKRLPVAGLSSHLAVRLKKAGYTGLELEKPELGRYATVGFTVQDAEGNREPYDSKRTLKKAITEILKTTNWRLMSSPITYRLGFLGGRLKGFEDEDELFSLLESEQKRSR